MACSSFIAATKGLTRAAASGTSNVSSSRMRVLAPEEQVNEAARQQYVEMVGEAKQKGVLVL